MLARWGLWIQLPLCFGAETSSSQVREDVHDMSQPHKFAVKVQPCIQVAKDQ